MEEQLMLLAGQYPWIMTICIVVGVFRLVFKPIVSIVKSVILYTPSKADDQVMEKIESSAAWRTFLWVIDYLLSIKLPGQG